MLCACHGEPCSWQKDKRRRAGGYWVCRIKRQEHNRASHARNREARLAARREQQRERWHAPEGGYVLRRRRHLAAQRDQIIDQLNELREAA